ncbi:hypothetical protein [Bathymodiolus japonicus methanotrophic gill symbiont]|nr:hypothetical protein [Bathymodiolus japonicus methanotrophic gill symbiont]
MGDALNALRPQRLRTKAASSLLPHWLDGYSVRKENSANKHISR